MNLLVLQPRWQLSILAVAACCLLLCARGACAQLEVNRAYGTLFPASGPTLMEEQIFALPPAELPDAPSTQPEQPIPASVHVNWLTPPGVSDDDATSSDHAGAEIFINEINMNSLTSLIRSRRGSRKSSDEIGDAITRDSHPEHYHWGGLIAQSFFFNGVESAWRMASDDQIRYLVAKKPFWHDYAASIKHFEMRRWNDGDDFLVNYVGHPLQGAVASYIEIQNSPTDREVELSATHAYWMSRFRGFLWSVVYSTHSEISPLGEAGIGNEGGWTYPKANCHHPCSIWNPAKMHYTNNTGWADFIITPTVGSLWVLAEDTLDRYVSDRVQGTDQLRVFPKVLRGTLNPSRTFANAMRLKMPWYRDFQHDEVAERYRPGIHFLRADESRLSRELPRFSIAGHYLSTPMGTYLKSCVLCFAGHGGGFEFDYAITSWLSASFAMDKLEGLSVTNATVPGAASVTGFGIRLVHDRPYNTLSLVIRPGFVVDKVEIPARADAPRNGSIAGKSYGTRHTAATLLLANDYKINRNFAIRSSFGATVVRYPSIVRDPPDVGQVPYLSWLSQDNYANHATLILQGGPVFHF